MGLPLTKKDRAGRLGPTLQAVSATLAGEADTAEFVVGGASRHWASSSRVAARRPPGHYERAFQGFLGRPVFTVNPTVFQGDRSALVS
jgi:hypothetical protein